MSAVSFKIPFVADGETFSVGGVEFIKFPEVNGTVPAVTKDILFFSRFGDDNDLRQSDVLQELKQTFLPRIIDAVGAENLCLVKTDLTCLDGLNPYGEMESLVSLPTLDFYRANVAVFDRYPTSQWWWLATPETASPHESPYWILCVAPSGVVNVGDVNFDYGGVRPFLSFNSSIFESSAE